MDSSLLRTFLFTIERSGMDREKYMSSIIIDHIFFLQTPKGFLELPCGKMGSNKFNK